MVKWSFPGSLYVENTRKNFKSKLVLVVVLVLESKGPSQDLHQMQHFLLPRSHSLFHSIILHILHKMFEKVDGFCIMQLSQSNFKVFWVVYLKGFMPSSLKSHDFNPSTYFIKFTIIYLINNNKISFFLPLNFSFPVRDDVLHNCRTHHYFFRKSTILS